MSANGESSITLNQFPDFVERHEKLQAAWAKAQESELGKKRGGSFVLGIDEKHGAGDVAFDDLQHGRIKEARTKLLALEALIDGEPSEKRGGNFRVARQLLRHRLGKIDQINARHGEGVIPGEFASRTERDEAGSSPAPLILSGLRLEVTMQRFDPAGKR